MQYRHISPALYGVRISVDVQLLGQYMNTEIVGVTVADIEGNAYPVEISGGTATVTVDKIEIQKTLVFSINQEE